MTSDIVKFAFDAVAPKFGEGVRLIGGFVGGPVVPALPEGWKDVRLVVALPAERMAGLQPWRDSVTMVVKTESGRTLHVNAREAGTWVRMVLRGHGGTLATIIESEIDGDRERLGELRDYALRSSTEETHLYFRALGKPEPAWDNWPHGTSDLSGRMKALESWITDCRR